MIPNRFSLNRARPAIFSLFYIDAPIANHKNKDETYKAPKRQTTPPMKTPIHARFLSTIITATILLFSHILAVRGQSEFFSLPSGGFLDEIAELSVGRELLIRPCCWDRVICVSFTT